uniref:UPAR/Ly6 domain-containing protein n=1 Tax=Fundulus heteroclitus TaxID=8078 RepID=A0A3Q2Q2Z7_FUNHE
RKGLLVPMSSCQWARGGVHPGQVTTSLTYKACASSALCPLTGNTTASVNFGAQSATASAQCCNTNNCNSQNLSSPTAQSPNSLQCIACDPITSQCTNIITCSGDETNCFTAKYPVQYLPLATDCSPGTVIDAHCSLRNGDKFHWNEKISF